MEDHASLPNVGGVLAGKLCAIGIKHMMTWQPWEASRRCFKIGETESPLATTCPMPLKA